MRVATIFTLDRMDFDAIFQQIKLKLSTKLYAFSELCGKESAPRITGVFIRPPTNFWQSFASRFLRKRYFSYYSEISIPITRRPLGCLLAFWAKTLRGQQVLF